MADEVIVEMPLGEEKLNEHIDALLTFLQGKELTVEEVTEILINSLGAVVAEGIEDGDFDVDPDDDAAVAVKVKEITVKVQEAITNYLLEEEDEG